MQSPASLPPGTRVERYRIEHVLGRGAMATVYAVRHTVLGTRHALKVLHRSSPHVRPTIRDRLVREGRLQAQLDPRFVLPVMDVLSVDGAPGLLMPLVVGCALDELLPDPGFSEGEVLAVFGSMLRAVGCAHARGVIHRDLKPANVLLDENRGRVRVRVADFGLARATLEAEGTDVTTASGAMMGTPAYAAPEQLTDAATVDHRADLWSLGVMLFELLTGRRPFRALSLRALLAAVQQGDFEREAVPVDWRSLIEALLQVDPERRPGSTDAIAEHLRILGEPSPLEVGSPIAEAIRQRVAARPRPSEPTPSVGEVSGLTYAPPEPPQNLPAERDRFVGRASDLAALKERFEDGAQVVSLLGIGGTGKTRLAVRFAWEQLPSYPGGAWFCDLSETRGIDGIVSTVAQTLGVPLGGADPVQQLGHAIAGRGRCLVVLDNFEQVARFAPQTLACWLDRATSAHFVVTTREVLGIPGEHLMHLDPLVPSEALELFVARARQTHPSFRTSGDSQGTMEALVELLDGLPLAIELAAARARVMGPAKMIDHMQERFRLLSSTAGASRHVDRHRTLRAALDWSWDLLSGDEQTALAQLSVFEASFTLEAAEDVLELDVWAIDAIQSLVDRSLVRPVADDRFELLMSVQAYASEQLGDTGDAGDAGDAQRVAAETRHGMHYALWGSDDALDSLRTHGALGRRQALRRDFPNLLTACRRATTASNGPIAVAALRAAWEVLEIQGPYALAVELAEAVVDLRTLSDAERTRASNVLAQALRRAGRPGEARAHYEAALALAQKLSDRRQEADARGFLGNLLRHQGRPDEAKAHHLQALSLARELGDERRESFWLGALGGLHREKGRYDEARRCLRAAIDLARKVGDPLREGMWLGNLGNTYMAQGRVDDAQTQYEAARRIASATGDRRNEGIWIGNLGILAEARGHEDDAHAHFHRALVIARELGDRRSEGSWLGHLGLLLQRRKHLDEARTHYETAQHIARELGDRRSEGLWIGNLGTAHLDQGTPDLAHDALQAAIAIARELGDRRAEGVWLGNLGRCLAALGSLEDARTRFTEGARLLRAVGDEAELAKLLASQARAASEPPS